MSGIISIDIVADFNIYNIYCYFKSQSINSFIIYFENIEFWAREQGDMSSSLSYTYNARTSNKPVDEWMDMLAIKHYSKTSCFESWDEISLTE